MVDNVQEKVLKRSRIMYIFQAATEYFVYILVAGSFLANLTQELGFSDSLTGILSSVISLGCLFQLLSLSIRPRSVKKLVIILSIANQVLFMLLYIIPVINIGSALKTVLFVIFIFTAYLTYNFAHPKKINWLMSLVDDRKRGSFTANKEIVSLTSGIAFSFVMGALIDYFRDAGKIRVAFILTAIVIFILMILHTLTMFFAVEKEMPQVPTKNLKDTFLDLIKNKNVIKVTVVFVLYYVSAYISTPFYGTYQLKELGLSLTFTSALVTCGSVARVLVSKFWGRYADKNSFAAMIEKCFVFLGFAQLCVIFAVPQTGKVMFILYNIFHGIALGGINSALINLIFDYVPVEQRSDSLAITQAIAGLTGFVTTLLISPVVSYIQNNGNKILGLPIYAQQFISIIAIIVTIAAVFYIRFIFIKKSTK